MGQSYRVRTGTGVNQQLTVQLDQEFEFLEILSLRIQQEEIYNRNCANYGVIVGRVTANNGFGLPNARVSVFIPITSVDQSNPIISSIYPYKSPTDKNEDGFRYNLLPYEKSYSKHAATGTLPTRNDVLTGQTAIEIYDTYYKYTTKTNESGDYMIMGAPLGPQTIFMDVDLSDIGEFSLTPQDLIRMGLATEAQVAGNQFKTSNDLNSLPQIISLTKKIEVSPLWGDETICQIAINRVDFDLRDEANVDIQPTSVFMGSIFSSPDNFRVRKSCRPRDNMGNLCSLTVSPGQILAIRQTISQDSEGNPVLEQFQLEQAGNIIDGDGTWLTELPMNLDYYITNEFGEKVISYDPSIGIPTKAKYRFKVKWQQPNELTLQTRRAHYLIPNVKEYGWTTSTSDPTNSPSTINKRKQASSYYFGLAWSGYTDGFSGTEKTKKLNSAIDCEDTFYEFKFNRVYTISSLIDEYKKGAKGRFIGIKEIDDQSCDSTVNKFPVNDGFRNFDFLFFLFSILMVVIQPVGLVLLTVAHILIWLYNLVLSFLCWLSGIGIRSLGWYPFTRWRKFCGTRTLVIRLPMITYPECQACDCKQNTSVGGAAQQTATGVLTYLSLPTQYVDGVVNQYLSTNENAGLISVLYSQAIAGQANLITVSNPVQYKMPVSEIIQIGDYNRFFSSKSLPLGERVNVFNTRKKYFNGINKIKVKIEPTLNVGVDKFHYDNSITVLSSIKFSPGDILTAVSVDKSTDTNWRYSAITQNGLVTGISGTSYTTKNATTMSINYATSPTTSQSVSYNLPYGIEYNNYKFPADIEYFQVVTSITWSEIVKIWNPNTIESFPNILYGSTEVSEWYESTSGAYTVDTLLNVPTTLANPIEYYSDIASQYVLVLQRGVDPYSPKYIQQYRLGTLFGTDENDSNFTFTASTRLNIPIQPVSGNFISVEGYNQNEMFYPSYFFRPGIDGNTTPGLKFSAFTTVNTGYYGLLDSQQSGLPANIESSSSQVLSKTSNGFYDVNPNGVYYDLSEDLTGGSAMSCDDYGNYTTYGGFNTFYYSKTIYNGVTWSAMTISNNVKNVMRTDRLPSSDILDGGNWALNPSLLQQNLNFGFNLINTDTEDITSDAFTTGADIVTADISGLTNSVTVFESFSCENMVGLTCYQGFGSDFEVNQNCLTKDSVELGCYVFLKDPLTDLAKDWKGFSEWGFRFRFFYGLCRGVLSQSFVNNWINGSLYMFPIQVDTYYDKQNKPKRPSFCEHLTYFESNSNNFYYRSSPYNGTAEKFVGMTTANAGSVNDVNLLFPTTIINLGMKDSFYGEITFDPQTNAYVLPSINSTSYGDTSDLINLFVISRITDETFLKQIIPLGDNSLNQLFSRNEKRIDGDLAQLLSINSEIGNINFSPEFYDSPTNASTILGTPGDPIVAVWFSSTTQDLQTKDYLTPGRIDFRGNNNVGFYPFSYGIKSQVVPFYQWNLNNTNTIFGNQKNTWATKTSDIIQNTYYQGLDRSTIGTKYFQNQSAIVNDLYARGYIFSVDENGGYITTGVVSDKFVVGAPFQFYFGVMKGLSALDKFKTKYSISE